MKNNPFSLDFGAQPNLFIPRYTEQSKIVETFCAEHPSSHMFLITGARGTGKTVLMTSISHEIRDKRGWIYIDLNPETDMLNSMASQIYQSSKKRYPKLKFEISIKGIGVSFERDIKYSDIQTDLDSMIKTLDKHNVKLLVTVDEANNSNSVRVFANYYQHCLREKMPLFVVMTGLYKNIRALQNNRSQTFLKRAPHIDLTPLNLKRIGQKYMEVFKLNADDANEMAKLTGGYSYAFQILGYLVYESGKTKPDNTTIEEYRLNLEECSYDKIWEELSASERRVTAAIAQAKDNATVKEVREALNMDSNNFSSYQNVLIKSGLLSPVSAYGHINFCLPYFKGYVLQQSI
ncbi:MAG: AAA family ATPase [Lachnospiraceae bacterium]|nr:AAA family ATPase [Lachnospiraceae bacterium]